MTDARHADPAVDIEHALWTAFVSRAILPGQPVIVGAWALQLHVTPEALVQELELMVDRGLVARPAPFVYEARPLLGGRELAELFVVRNRLEPWIAEEAAKAGLLPESAELLRDLAAIPSAPTLTILAERDRRFHALLGSLSGLAFASRAVDSLNAAFHIYRRLDGHSHAPASDNEHLAIAEALISGDAVGARVAMQRHLSSSTSRLLQV